MNINFDKIETIYGKETLELINNNIEDVVSNINYLISLGFDDVEDIFERYTLIFIEDTITFKDKIDKLIKVLGNNYVDILEENMEIWENLL
jgi:hypothetical protein